MEGETRSIDSGLRTIAGGIFAGSLVVITAAIVASLNPRGLGSQAPWNGFGALTVRSAREDFTRHHQPMHEHERGPDPRSVNQRVAVMKPLTGVMTTSAL
jgi:hypothetical protein